MYHRVVSTFFIWKDLDKLEMKYIDAVLYSDTERGEAIEALLAIAKKRLEHVRVAFILM